MCVRFVLPEPLTGSSTVERVTVNYGDDGFESLPVSQIQKEEKMSFFSKIESFFKKFFTNTTWEQKVSAGIAITAPGLQTLIALTAGQENADQVASIVKEVQTDLATLSALLSQAQAGQDVHQTIINILEAVKNNLSDLLAAGHIKDQDTLTKVTAIVNGVIGEIEAVLPLVPVK